MLVNRLVRYWKPFQEKSSRLVRVPSLSFMSALRSAVNLEVVKDLQPSERSSHFRENRHRPIIQEFEGALFKVPFTRHPYGGTFDEYRFWSRNANDQRKRLEF